MKNKISSSSENLLYIALTFILLLIVGCSENDNENNKESYIQFANPANSFKQNSKARELDLNTLDSLIINIMDTNNRILTTANVVKASNTVRLSVPSNTPLIVSATATVIVPDGEVNNETFYYGEVTIASVQPGAVSQLSLLLYELGQTTDPISVDIPLPETTLSGKSKGTLFSRDNNYVLFFSDDSNLVNNDTNNVSDVFLRDLSTNTIKNLHTNSSGEIASILTGSDTVTEADISADGIYVVFASYANNLVFNDTNGTKDIFLKNTLTGKVTRINERAGYDNSDFDSYNPQISDDGSIIVFYSEAELVSGFSETLFVYDRLNEQLFNLKANDTSDKYKLSGDGNIIVYQAKNKGGLKITNLLSPDAPEFASESIIETLPKTAIGAISINETQIISNANINFNFDVDQDGEHTLFIPTEDSPALIKNQHYLYNSVSKRISLVSRARTNLPFSGALTQSNSPALSNDGRYVVFSYDNITYVRSIQYDNMLEIGDGSNPFISTTGDKIGYENNDRVFVIDNPLYIPEPEPTPKATTPANVMLELTDGGVILSWDSVANASYYRIYQLEESDIASKLSDPLFKPVIHETTETTFSFEPYDFAQSEVSSNFYFIVVAVNENGEGAASIEVSDADEAPLFSVSSFLSSASTLSLDTSITIDFSEPVDTSTIESAISVTDGGFAGVPIEINFNSGLETTTATISFLSMPSQEAIYTLQVDTTLKSMSGLNLSSDYAASFSFNHNVNEGTTSSPVAITPTYSGTVGISKSYYSLNIPASEASNITYAIYLKNESYPVGFSASANNGAIVNCEATGNLCLVENVTGATQLNLEVDASTIFSGASFDIMLDEVTVNSATNVSATSLSISMFPSSRFLLVKSLEPGNDFVFEDITSISDDDASYRVLSHLVPSPACDILVPETPAICRFTANGTGDILFEFIPDFELNYPYRNAKLDVIRSQTLDLLGGANNISIEGEKYAKFSGLEASKDYYLAFSQPGGNINYDVISRISLGLTYCSGNIEQGNDDIDSCAFTSPSNGEILVKLDQLNSTIGLTSAYIEIFELAPAIKSLSFSNAILNQNERFMFAKITDLGTETWHTVTMTPSNGSRPFGKMMVYDNLFSGPQCKSEIIADIATCELNRSSSSLIAFEFTDGQVENGDEFLVTATPVIQTPPNAFALDAIDSAISPVKYFQDNTLPDNSNILITATELLSISPLKMDVYSKDWRRKACTTIRVGNNLLCVTDWAGNQNNFNIKVYDHHIPIAISIPVDLDQTIANIKRTVIPDNTIELDTLIEASSSGDYKIYKYSGLNRNTEYSVDVYNVTLDVPGLIPFYIVPWTGDNLICKSSTFMDNPDNQNCLTSSMDTGFIIVDTTLSPTGLNYEILISNPSLGAQF